jgi:hypothetical protein
MGSSSSADAHAGLPAGRAWQLGCTARLWSLVATASATVSSLLAACALLAAPHSRVEAAVWLLRRGCCCVDDAEWVLLCGCCCVDGAGSKSA